MNEYCSWCFRKSIFSLLERNNFSRNIYICGECGRRAVKCKKLGCSNMAQATEAHIDSFCAEHDNAQISFEYRDKLLVEISDFESIFKEDSSWKKYAPVANLALNAAVLINPVSSGLKLTLAGAKVLHMAGQYIVSREGRGKSVVDDSSAIFQGDALSGGVNLLPATRGAPGALESRSFLSACFREIEHFSIRRVKSGDDHGVIFINGFLSQMDSDTKVWEEQLAQHFFNRSWYHLDWEATSLKKLGIHISDSPNGAADFSLGLAKSVAALAMNALNFSSVDVMRNPWHASMVKAQMAGELLADAIARTPHQKFTLVGHSLGARVIYFALKALSMRPKVSIEDVFLLGGAVGGGEKDSKGWAYAEKSVRGKIHNCLSKRDSVLEYLYTNANLRRSDPIGYAGISRKSEKILNFDCTDLVDGHTSWRQNFGLIHRRIKGG